MGTKLTGWFLPLPFLAWAIIYRDRRAMLALVVGVLLAFAVLVVLIPPWWHNPLLGLDQFFQSNLSRAKTTPLSILFLGKIYETPTGSLPWYNTTFMDADGHTRRILRAGAARDHQGSVSHSE